MATYYSQASGNWSASAMWNTARNGSDTSGVPADNDAVVIQGGHTVVMDADTSGFANGIAGVTIEGGATPGMLAAKADADGKYWLKIKTGMALVGTLSTNRGRLFAGAGTWNSPSALPFGRKFVIDLQGTAKIDAANLDIKLHATHPTLWSVRTYGVMKTVESVDTSTDRLTITGHGWTNGLGVKVRSSGTLPAGLDADVFYFIADMTTNSFKLAMVGGGVAVKLISTGSGTIEVYDGHTSTSTATLNVLDDVTADPCWTTVAGENACVLADEGPTTCDQQRTTLAAIAADTITLGANVDSGQYPGARIWLTSRNVAIRSNTTSSNQQIIAGTNANLIILDCELRSTAGTGTTFYGEGIYYPMGTCVVSGVISGCTDGIYYGTSVTMSGAIVGCSYGAIYATRLSVSGTIAGCQYGVYSNFVPSISGEIRGCNSAVYGGNAPIISGLLSGCSTAASNSPGLLLTGVIRCSGTGVGNTGSLVITGSIYGCSSGLSTCSGGRVSGLIHHCGTAINGSSCELRGASLENNTTDIGLNSCIVRGWAAKLASTSQVVNYKFSAQPMTDGTASLMIYDPANADGTIQRGYLACYTPGGYTKTSAYAAGTHGTPPAELAYVHESKFEDNGGTNWVDLPFWGEANKQLTITVYQKVSTTDGWTDAPYVAITDPGKGWGETGEELATATAFSIADTDWHTTTLTYTPAYDRQLNLRMRGKGGNASGTGAGYLYWYYTIQPPESGGIAGGAGIFGSAIIKSTGVVG